MTTTSQLAILDRAGRIATRFTSGLTAVCGVLFCVALVGLTVDIGMRLAFDSSIRGMQEIVSDLFLYAFFLGAAALYARNEDVSLTFFIRLLPVRWQAIVATGVALAISASMAIVSFETVSLTIEQRGMFSPELGISESVRLAPLAVATASIACTSLLDAWRYAIWAAGGARPSRGDEAPPLA